MEREEWICQVPEAEATEVADMAAVIVVAPAEVIGEGRVADPADIMEARAAPWVADPAVWDIVRPWAVCLPWVTDPHHPHHPVTADTATVMAGAAAAW